MASIKDEGTVLEKVDKDVQMAGTTELAKTAEGKLRYKSFKKKYRKMRIKFDDAMVKSNEYFNQERKATDLAKRLKQENDQLLDLLLDVNESAQIPTDKRIDILTDVPSLTPIPQLVYDDELPPERTLQTPEEHALYHEIRAMMTDRAPSPPPYQQKSFAALMAATPHLTSDNPHVSDELRASLEPDENQAAPLSYLTPDQLDDYLYDIDAFFGTVPPLPPQFNNTPQHDLTFGNYHSPYNWLRRNVPQIFLQDGESSEKSQGKPGALRGAGKRASIPAPSKPDALEFVEEDGLGYDGTLAGQATKGKRKRDEDDSGYHPKSGGKEKKPRQARKKKASDESTASTGSTKKGKGRGKVVELVQDPDAHPFGPV